LMIMIRVMMSIIMMMIMTMMMMMESISIQCSHIANLIIIDLPEAMKFAFSKASWMVWLSPI
jgi:hypothetical protein